MNKFEGSGQDNKDYTTNNESIPVDIDKAALINRRHAEGGSAEGSDGASVVHGMGHQLQAGRIACNLSIEDVSRHLRLSVKQVEALEKEDFEKLPTGTFLRGFVRNYACLVKLDPKPLLQTLPSSSEATIAHTTLNPMHSPRATSFSPNWTLNRQGYRNGRKQNGLLKVVLLVIFLLVTYGIYHSIEWKNFSLISSAAKTDIEHSIEAEVINGQSTIELRLPISPAITSGAQSNTNQTAQTMDMEPHQKKKHFSSVETLSSVAATNLNPGGGDLAALRFKFIGDSWVEVRDQANTIVYKQANVSGTEQVVNGKRPLSLIISNAIKVNLTYNGREIDLIPYTNENDGTARFTLE